MPSSLNDNEKPWRVKDYEQIRKTLFHSPEVMYVQVLYAKRNLEIAYHDSCYKPQIRTTMIKQTHETVRKQDDVVRKYNTGNIKKDV